MIQRFQEMVLAAIEWLGPGCRIADIRVVVEDRLEQGRAFGAVFTTLDRLEAAGLVTWRLGPSQPRRGGRASPATESACWWLETTAPWCSTSSTARATSTSAAR